MPATYTAYPTAAELTTFIATWGITLPTLFDSDVYSFAAIDEWERKTLYKPFLVGSSTAYRYTPPGPNRNTEYRGGAKRLFLDRGFVSISEVRTGITVDDTTGTLLVLDVDYRLYPHNAAADLRPYTQIEFIGTQFGPPNSIKVTGLPGYSTLLSADVYQAVMHMAAGAAMVGLQVALSSDAIEWAEGDVRERGSVELVQKMGEHWRKSAESKAVFYRRAQ